MSYPHITERKPVISHSKSAGYSLREIGLRLGRDHTNIMREISRNRPTYADDPVLLVHRLLRPSLYRRKQTRLSRVRSV